MRSISYGAGRLLEVCLAYGYQKGKVCLAYAGGRLR